MSRLRDAWKVGAAAFYRRVLLRAVCARACVSARVCVCRFTVVRGKSVTGTRCVYALSPRFVPLVSGLPVRVSVCVCVRVVSQAGTLRQAKGTLGAGRPRQTLGHNKLPYKCCRTITQKSARHPFRHHLQEININT